MGGKITLLRVGDINKILQASLEDFTIFTIKGEGVRDKSV